MFLIDRVPDHIFESLQKSDVDTSKIMLASYCDMNNEHSFCDTYVVVTTENIYVISGAVSILCADGKKPIQEWRENRFTTYDIGEIEALELDEMQSSARLVAKLKDGKYAFLTAMSSRMK